MLGQWESQIQQSPWQELGSTPCVAFKETSGEGAFGLVPHARRGLNLLSSFSRRLATGDGVRCLRRAPFRYGAAPGGAGGVRHGCSLKAERKGPVWACRVHGRADPVSEVRPLIPPSQCLLLEQARGSLLEALLGLDQQTEPKSSFCVTCRRKSVGTAWAQLCPLV